MTEPTANPNASANIDQGAAASIKNENNTHKNDPSIDAAANEDKGVQMPSKAALLTLFTLSDANEASGEQRSNERADIVRHMPAQQPAG